MIDISDFHVGPYVTAVGAAELLTEVRIPVRPGAGSAYEKLERRAGDFAIAAAAAAVWIDGGVFADVGIALSAVGPITIELTRAEELLRARRRRRSCSSRLVGSRRRTRSPSADSRGPIDYKRHLVGVLAKRALRRATARALHQEA